MKTASDFASSAFGGVDVPLYRGYLVSVYAGQVLQGICACSEEAQTRARRGEAKNRNEESTEESFVREALEMAGMLADGVIAAQGLRG